MFFTYTAARLVLRNRYIDDAEVLMTIIATKGMRRLLLTPAGVHDTFLVPLEPEALTALREAHGYSAEEIAKRLGITTEVWEGLESGALRAEDIFGEA